MHLRGNMEINKTDFCIDSFFSLQSFHFSHIHLHKVGPTLVLVLRHYC